jgi:hypothetical protein
MPHCTSEALPDKLVRIDPSQLLHQGSTPCVCTNGRPTTHLPSFYHPANPGDREGLQLELHGLLAAKDEKGGTCCLQELLCLLWPA